MSDQSLGTISALVRIKLDQLAADAAAAKTLFSQLEQGATASVTKLANASAENFAKVGQVAKEAGRDLEIAGAAIVGSLGVAVKVGEDWNQTLLHISGNTSMTRQQTEEMRSVVEQLGQSSAAPLDRLANGYMHVTNFAFKGAEATRILTEATKYAVATGDDASKVSEVLAGTLHNFAMGGEQAGGAMNLLHTAAARANSTLGEFASAAGPAFAAAHTYGISLAEAAAAIQVFTQHQYTASEGTTLFANLVEHVANPTRITKKALEDLGLEHSKLAKDMTFTGLQARGVVGFLKDLDDAAKATGKSSEELAKTLFRGRMGGTGTAVLVQNLREYTKAATELQEIFDKGAAGIWQYDAANKSLTGQIEILKTNFTILAGQIEAALLPAINSTLTAVHDLTTWFENLSTPQKEMIVQTAALVGVVLLASGAVLTLVGSVTSFVASLVLAMPAITAVGAALLPFVGWIAAIGAAIGLLAVAWAQDWGNIREYTQQFVGWIKPYLAQAWDDIKFAMGFAMAIWKKDWSTIFYDLGVIARKGMDEIKKDFNLSLDQMGQGLRARGQVIVSAWKLMLDNMRNHGIGVFALIKTDWGGLWSSLSSTVSSAVRNIISVIQSFFGAAFDAGANLWRSFANGFSGASNSFSMAGDSNAMARGLGLAHLGFEPQGHSHGTLHTAGELSKLLPVRPPGSPAPSSSGGGGGGGRGGGGGGAMDALKEKAQEARRALNEVYEALYKLSHDDFDNQRHDAMKEFLENRAKGVAESANVALLAARQLKIQHDEEENHYQKMSALQKLANLGAYNMLEPGRKIAAAMEEARQNAAAFTAELVNAAQEIGAVAAAAHGEFQRQAADKGLSNLLGGADLGEMSRQFGSFVTKTVDIAKKASQDIKEQEESARDAVTQKQEAAVASMQARAKKEEAQWKRLMQGMADQMSGVFENAFTDLFEHGWKNFFKDILQGFEKMLEEMVIKLLAKSIIFGFFDLITGGGAGDLLGGFSKFLGFDDASNDRKAEHWGFDFADMFGRGIKDFDSKRSPTRGAPTSGQTVVHAPITVHAVINHEMDARRLGDILSWQLQTRGVVYQGTG